MRVARLARPRASCSVRRRQVQHDRPQSVLVEAVRADAVLAAAASSRYGAKVTPPSRFHMMSLRVIVLRDDAGAEEHARLVAADRRAVDRVPCGRRAAIGRADDHARRRGSRRCSSCGPTSRPKSSTIPPPASRRRRKRRLRAVRPPASPAPCRPRSRPASASSHTHAGDGRPALDLDAHLPARRDGRLVRRRPDQHMLDAGIVARDDRRPAIRGWPARACRTLRADDSALAAVHQLQLRLFDPPTGALAGLRMVGRSPKRPGFGFSERIGGHEAVGRPVDGRIVVRQLRQGSGQIDRPPAAAARPMSSAAAPARARSARSACRLPPGMAFALSRNCRSEPCVFPSLPRRDHVEAEGEVDAAFPSERHHGHMLRA